MLLLGRGQRMPAEQLLLALLQGELLLRAVVSVLLLRLGLLEEGRQVLLLLVASGGLQVGVCLHNWTTH